MNKNLAASLMVVGVIAAGMLAAPRLLEAQQGKSTSPHVIVIKDVMHVVSPRLGGTTPIPPAYGVRKQIPLRHPMPLQSRLAPAPSDPVLQSSVQPLVSTTSGLNFLGIGEGLGNFSVAYAPPDTNGSAGATQYVQWVNVNFAVFDKTTGSLKYGPALGSTLFQALGGACASSDSGDIISQYDKQAGRWVMMQPVFSSPYAFCVAVSTTSDALGTYNEYQFSIPSNYFPDYPKLGVWPDGYYMSYNAFKSATGPFVSGYACALDRAAMLQGSSATMQCFSANGYYSLLPADLDGDSGAPGTTGPPPAGAPNDFVDFYNTGSLNLFQFHVDWQNSSNSSFTGPINIPVAAFSEACNGGTCIPQQGSTTQLDSLGDRLMYRFAYRNFGSYQSWVVSQSVDTGNGYTGIRWYQLRDTGSGPALYQQGTFAPDSNFRWMPSIAQDEAGDIALGYSVSSSSMYPAISFTGRTPGDALGTMESENSIVTGGGSQTGNLSRWGDYSDMSVDPTNDCTFWYTTEYLASSGSFNWSTRIASFSFPGCGTTATPSFSLSATPSSQTITAGGNTSYTVDVTPSNSYTSSVNLSITSPASLPTGMTATFAPNPVDITSASAVSSTLSVTTTSQTPAGTYNLTITGDDGSLSSNAQVSVVVQPPPTPDFSLSSSPSSSTVMQGSPATYTIAVSPSGDYAGTVNLSASSLPPGATASFSSPSVSTSGGSVVKSTLTVRTTSSTTPNTYNITVTGTDSSGSPTHSIQVGLTVQQQTSSDFTVTPSPLSGSATQGSSFSYTVTVAGSNSPYPFNGTVNLSVSGVPARTSASFGTSSISGSGSTTLTISPHHNAKNGTYTLTITGTSGSISHSSTVTFIVGNQATPDFSLSASPGSQTVTPGNGANYTVTVSPSGGFSSSVSLSATGLPNGASATFSPSSVSTSSGSASSALAITTSATNTPTGTYPITITSSGGGLTHSTQVTLVVQSSGGSGDFSVSLTPSSQSVGPKSSVSYTVTVASLNGFTGTVNLSLSGLPKRTNGSFSTSSITASGTSTLTISTTPKSPSGTYTLSVTGISGSTSHTATATLNITP